MFIRYRTVRFVLQSSGSVDQGYHNWKLPDGICVPGVPLAILLFIRQEFTSSFRHHGKPPPKDKGISNNKNSSDSIMNARGLG